MENDMVKESILLYSSLANLCSYTILLVIVLWVTSMRVYWKLYVMFITSLLMFIVRGVLDFGRVYPLGEAASGILDEVKLRSANSVLVFFKSICVYYFIIEVHYIKVAADSQEEALSRVQLYQLRYLVFYTLYVLTQLFNFSEEILYNYQIQHPPAIDVIKSFTVAVAGLQDVCMAIIFMSIIKFYYKRATRNSKEREGFLQRMNLAPRQRILFIKVVFFGLINLLSTLFQTFKPIYLALFGGMHFLNDNIFLTPSQFIIYLTENVLELWISLSFLYLAYAFHKNQKMQQEGHRDTTNYQAPQILSGQEEGREDSVMHTQPDPIFYRESSMLIHPNKQQEMPHKRTATTLSQDPFNAYKEDYADLLLINNEPEQLEETQWPTGQFTNLRETLISQRNSEKFTEYIKRMLEQ